MDKLPLPLQSPRPPPIQRKATFRSLLSTVLLAVASFATVNYVFEWAENDKFVHIPLNAIEIVQKCEAINLLPGPPPNFHTRSTSDRFEPGTPTVLIQNATIWTGQSSGREVIHGDVLLSNGVIKAVGEVDIQPLRSYSNLVTLNAGGAWVTPGIVDMHSHLGVDSAPYLSGSSDTNSLKGLVLPWLRSLDGLNTHDEAYQLSISGGVTTANILPGSADAIGGQAFTIKLRPTSERSSSSMVIEPPYTLNGTYVDPSLPPRWRQMKHACGENPSRAYDGTRMDTIWAFRQGYDTARKVKKEQDQYCAKALAGQWEGLGDFPENLQWEALVDVLRGRVKVHNHCYEATDLDGIVRLTNEFKFSVAAFHHAHETYLVPDLLKRAYGHPPAVALFATHSRYKREAYRGSEFAPKVLADNGLRVVMKSDHPVLNSRHLLYEAQQAHYYGLPSNLALASVTSTPATVLGYDHRIGFVKPGYDADIVVWDSHPLSLGAAPTQVYIDGIAQLKDPHIVRKPSGSQVAPKTPNFDKEAEDAVKWDGLPPLETTQSTSDAILFKNVASVLVKDNGSIKEIFSSKVAGISGDVFVKDGHIVCAGIGSCGASLSETNIKVVDLEGGSISPGLVSFGGRLALNHIDGEASSNDGYVLDPLAGDTPEILGKGPVVHAIDGLQFATRDALIAYRNGVTTGITEPSSRGFLAGLSVAFSTGAPHRLATGAIVQEVAGLHFSIGASSPSVSTQIAALRNLLIHRAKGELGHYLDDVLDGRIPLVIAVESADIMASLISLKKELEEKHEATIRLTFVGANEAHLLAKELAEAGVGVILRPSRPFPGTWKSRRILPGPPLTEQSAITHLRQHGVTVAIGVEQQESSRNLRFDVGWAALESNGRLSQPEAIALASTNVEKLLGVREANQDLVVTRRGDLLSFDGKVIGVISPALNGVQWAEV